MITYLVEYRIEVEADTYAEAAMQAQICCLNPHYDTRVWTVTREDGDYAEIHLDQSGKHVEERDDLMGLANG